MELAAYNAKLQKIPVTEWKNQPRLSDSTDLAADSSNSAKDDEEKGEVTSHQD